MRERVSITDIARESGVSVCTVSRVVNGKDLERIGVATRERVQKVVDKYNYTPNSAAKALVTGKSGLLGVQLLSSTTPVGSSKTLGWLDEVASGLDYTLLLGLSNWSLEKEAKALRVMLRRGVEGIMWMPIGERPQEKLLKEIEDLGIPFVFLFKDLGFGPSVIVDHFRGGVMAVEYLHGLGRSKLAFVAKSPDTDRFCKLKIRGFQMAMEDCGEEAPLCVVEGECANLEAGIADFWRDKPWPEGIVTSSDEVALAVYNVLLRQGVRIGDEVAVMGFNDDYYAARLHVPLTTINYDQRAFSESAVTLLARRICGEAVESVFLRPHIVERRSCGEKSG